MVKRIVVVGFPFSRRIKTSYNSGVENLAAEVMIYGEDFTLWAETA